MQREEPFTICGKCPYATGMYQFQAGEDQLIDGSCTLIPRYSGILREVTHDTNCLLWVLGKREINYARKIYRREIESVTRNNTERIHVLDRFYEEASERPVLPQHRGAKHFNIADRIMVYFAPTHFIQSGWHSGYVRHGYRHHDGCVSYQLSEDVGPQEPPFWGSEISVPYVMRYDEYQWFYDRPLEYQIWAELAYERTFNGEHLEVAPIP